MNLLKHYIMKRNILLTAVFAILLTGFSTFSFAQGKTSFKFNFGTSFSKPEDELGTVARKGKSMQPTVSVELGRLINYGASPRGSINLALAAKCYAFIKRRGYVIPEDVRAVVYDVLRHRIGITYEAEAENITTEAIITKVLNQVQVP